ncbi:MAG: zinc ribbon domain-containing protein [Muribaculaceae bacterium]|nr:zinc ribbon domain-containing protein [Muribaculaceae bacterium]
MPLTKCTDCGQDVSTSAKTCPRCGAPIASVAAPQPQPQQPQPQQLQKQPQVTVVQQAEPQPATKHSNQPKKKGSWWKFFLGLLLGLILGILVSYFLFAPLPNSENYYLDKNDSTTVQTDSISHPVHNVKSAQEAKSHSKSSHKSSKEASKQKDDESDKPSEEETGPDKSRKEIGTMMKDAKKRVDAKNLRDALGN